MRAALVAAAIALAACQPPGAQSTRLTPEGYGEMRIGVSIAEARRISGQPLDAEALEPDVPGACVEQEYRTADGALMWLMFEDDRLTRVAIGEEATAIRTAEDIGVGSTDAEVRAAYPNAIEEPAHYSPAPAHDLIAWTVPERSGLRFEINEQGRVSAVHAGGPSILYVEGCA